MKRIPKQFLRRSRRGVAIIEVAIIFPVLLLLVLGAIEYSWLFLKSHQVTNAARQAARVGALVGADSARVVVVAQDALNAGGMGAMNVQITVNPTEVLDIIPGDLVTVEVLIPYNEVSLLDLLLIPTPTQLRASVSMAKEGTALKEGT